MAIDVLTSGEGRPLTDAVGEHVATGFVILNKPDAPRALLLGLGDGPWHSCRDLWYHGERLDTATFHFHPGTPSAGVDDPVQGIDSFFPAGLTYSQTAYVAVRLPDTIEEIDPAGVIGRYKTRLLPDYNTDGQEIARDYSSNPARATAFYLRDKAQLPASRIDWPSWCAWRDNCDHLIEWNDGIATSPRQIKRFEAHVPFTSGIDLIDALNAFADLSCYCVQDDGEKIHFQPLFGQVVSFTFTTANIIEGSVATFPIDVRNLPNRQVVRFRNLDSDYLGPASWAARNQASVDQIGIRDASELQFWSMTYSQAQRLSRYFLRKARLWQRIELRATGESFAVLPGDKVRIVHPAVDDVQALVLETEDESGSADTRRIVVAVLTEELYLDTDHVPIPVNLQVPTTPVVE